MHRRHLPIAERCSVPWSEMQGTVAVRHCASCSKDVYFLSMLTEREAKAALAIRPQDTCLRYVVDREGNVVFYPEPAVVRAAHATRATIAAALTASALAACSQPEPEIEPAPSVATLPVSTPAAPIGAASPAVVVPAVVRDAGVLIVDAPAHDEADAGQSCSAGWKASFQKPGRSDVHLQPHFRSIDELLDVPQGLYRTPSPPSPPRPAGMLETPTRDQVLAAMRGARDEVANCKTADSDGYVKLELEGRTGRAINITVEGAGGKDAQCIVRAVKRARVPPFARARFPLKIPFRLLGLGR